jgi:thioredoxin reductase (NADPH)
LVIRDHDVGKSMSRYLVDRIARQPNVEVLRHTEVRELIGTGGRLTAVALGDNRTGESREVPATALFVFIGAEPHSGWLGGQLALDSHGFILTGQAAARTDGRAWQHLSREPFLLETNRPGVFAIGDVRSGSVKRVAAAVGEGAMAVRMVHEYLGGGQMPPSDSHAARRLPGPAGTL